jgi:hypothetical protein
MNSEYLIQQPESKVKTYKALVAIFAISLACSIAVVSVNNALFTKESDLNLDKGKSLEQKIRPEMRPNLCSADGGWDPEE